MYPGPADLVALQLSASRNAPGKDMHALQMSSLGNGPL